MVSGCVAGYRSAFPQHRFDLVLPAGPVELVGAPDLVAQLLDKLADNAREFSAPGTPIGIEVTVEWDWARLSVSNFGPPLPDAMASQLFESMVSVRPVAAGEPPRSEPHLGLGLFIVRLIAEYHGGRAAGHAVRRSATSRDRLDGGRFRGGATLPGPAPARHARSAGE